MALVPKQDELLELIRTTWECEDGATRTANSVDITDNVNKLFTELDARGKEIADLNNKIDDLRRVNSELYTRVTATGKPKEEEKNEPVVDEIEKVLEECY
jgi:hypothetical protein